MHRIKLSLPRTLIYILIYLLSMRNSVYENSVYKQAPEAEGCATGDRGDRGDRGHMGERWDRGHR